MKNFFLKSTMGLLLIILYLVSTKLKSAEDFKEYSMKSETGEIVLTKEPCTFKDMGLKQYPYAAYATEKGHANHEGCWRLDIVDRYKAILIYFPEIDATGVYNPDLFLPRGKEPPVKSTVRFENNKAIVYGIYEF